jgi:hypothetical protein
MEKIGMLCLSRKDTLRTGRFGTVVQGKFKNCINVAVAVVSKRDFLIEPDVLRQTQNWQNVLHYYYHCENNEFL